VAGSILNAVKDLLDVEETSILLKDMETGDLILWQYTPPQRNLTIRLQPGQGIGGWVLATGKSAIVNDVRADERWANQFDKGNQFTTRSMLAVPILLNQEVIGVIEALNKLNGDFIEADERWLRTLSQWAAVAIGNANTYAELKRTHERLSDAKKQAAMAQMVLNLAHKINNSVGALRVFALEALEESAQLQSDPTYLIATIRSILENAEETLLMVRRIREATELQSNSLMAVEVVPCLEAAIEASRLAKQITIERDYASAIVPVAASPERLTEVFVNILDNAADALGQQGLVRLTLRPTDTPSVEVLIQDNGAGIAEHLRASLFDPFVTSKANGLGLGLWMVKLYIELIGGSINVNTATGKGSTFRIILPAWEG
jgi:signal transduction histidine kinase